jgi:hypothetical protein
MAPVPLESDFSYWAVATAAGHLATSVLLTARIIKSLSRARRAISPAQDTRERTAQRSRNVSIFTTLAAASLGWTIWGVLRYATLSYKVWDHERVGAPTRFYGAKEDTWGNIRATSLHLAQWLTDTPVYRDAAEILAEKARRFWWQQQIDLGLISFTMLSAIEGRRRNIPLLWAYQLLAQLVSLPFAQNLFFVAILLTPTPLPQPSVGSSRVPNAWARFWKAKPSNWTPNPVFYYLVLALNLCAIGATPFFVDTPTFGSVVTATRVLSFVPIVLPHVLPLSWGTVHADAHEAYGSYAGIFRMILFFSMALHAKATVVGLAYNAPETHVHRHSIHLPFDMEKRSAWDRTTSAFGRILTATSDHPVVSKVGWDVLISGLSLGLWATIRAVDIVDVVTYPLLQKSHEDADEQPDTDEQEGATIGNKSRAAKTALRPAEDEGSRRRGRSQRAKKSTDCSGVDPDGTYKPTRAEAAEASEGDVLPGAGEEGWESAALTWGATILGGLGAGSAAVYGAECIAR